MLLCVLKITGGARYAAAKSNTAVFAVARAPPTRLGMFSSVLQSPTSPTTRKYSFGDAVLAGWGDDGGMLWPMDVPQVNSATLDDWAALTYPQLCAAILKRFIPPDDADVSPSDVDAIVLNAFGAFGSDSVVDVVPLYPTMDGTWAINGWHIAELWHGPTLAFKDLGMSVLGRTLSHLLRKRNQRLTLLVGTSGDTGSSAIEAVRGLPNISIVCLYPLQSFSSITAVQERQMTSVAEVEENVHVIGIEGTSDDLDVPMEACFRDTAFKAAQKLGSVNSVNIVRLLVQAVHYFYSYLRVREKVGGGIVQLSIPCGAGGHLAAGLLAVEMGLPVKLLAATNANDALHRVLNTGRMESGVKTQQTVSPSMDIQLPYNVWRILYVASGGDGEAVRKLQRALSEQGSLELPAALREAIAKTVRSVAVSDDETLEQMRHTHAEQKYLLDPHTAVCVAAAKPKADGIPRGFAGAAATICMGCAHPVKFLPTVQRAFGCASIDAAMALVKDMSHKNVAKVGAMARQLEAAKPPPSNEPETPPGCTTVFRRGENWEARLRVILREVTARAEQPRSKL